MKKRVISAFIPVIVVLSISTSITAASAMTEIKAYMNNSIKITLNGQSWKPAQPPITYQGSTYLPLRAVGEALDAQVSWDSAT